MPGWRTSANIWALPRVTPSDTDEELSLDTWMTEQREKSTRSLTVSRSWPRTFLFHLFPHPKKRNSIFHGVRAWNEGSTLFYLISNETTKANLPRSVQQQLPTTEAATAGCCDQWQVCAAAFRYRELVRNGQSGCFSPLLFLFSPAEGLSDPCSHRRKNKMRRDLSAHDREPATWSTRCSRYLVAIEDTYSPRSPRKTNQRLFDPFREIPRPLLLYSLQLCEARINVYYKIRCSTRCTGLVNRSTTFQQNGALAVSSPSSLQNPLVNSNFLLFSLQRVSFSPDRTKTFICLFAGGRWMSKS